MSKKMIKKKLNKFWFFCEGEKTEKYYLEGLKQMFREYKFEIKADNKKTSAEGIKEYYERYKKSNLKKFRNGDYIFFIFDCDQNSNESLEKIISFAKKHNIILLFSNPCIEYWFLAHYEYYKNKINACDLNKRLIKNYNYDKVDKFIFEKIQNKTSNAILNVKKVIKENGYQDLICCESNPCSTFYKLYEMFPNMLDKEK